MAEEIKIVISGDNKASVQIDKVTKSLDSLEKQTEETGRTFKNIFETAAGVAIGNFATKVAGQAVAAVRSFARTLGTDAVRAAQVQQDAINRLNTSLALTGDFSRETSQEFQNFASQMQRVSVVGDEVILNQLALAKTFGTTNEQAKDLVEAAINLSAATGISLDSAVKNLGKTLGGLTGELGESVPALRQFSQEQLKAGAAIEFALSRFGGSALGQIQTFSGAVRQLENTFGDFQEAVGGVTTNNQVFSSAISETSKIISELTGFITENEQSLREGMGRAFIFGIDAATVFVGALEAVNVAVDAVSVAFEITGKTIAAVLASIQAALSGDFQGAADIFEQLEKDASAALNTIGEESTVLTELGTALARIKMSSEQGFEAVRSGASATVDPINQATEAQRQFNEELVKQGEAVVKSIGLEGFASREEQLAAETEALKGAREAQLITEEEFFLAREELIRQDFANRQNALQEFLDKNKASQEQQGQALDALERRRTTEIAKNEAQRAAAAEKANAQRVAAQRESLNQIATLQSSGNKTLFRIGQAGAIAGATVDGVQAIQKTLAAFPYPFSIPFVAAVTAAQAANIARIAAAKPPGFQDGITEIPRGFENDSLLARLSSGERVVDGGTNEDLKSFLANNQGTVPLLAQISEKLDRLGGDVTVNIGNERITQVVRAELESGGTIEVEA